jgi:hypothetical protein
VNTPPPTVGIQEDQSFPGVICCGYQVPTGAVCVGARVEGEYVLHATRAFDARKPLGRVDQAGLKKRRHGLASAIIGYGHVLSKVSLDDELGRPTPPSAGMTAWRAIRIDSNRQ